MEDADRFLTLIQNCFIDDSPVNNSESEQITEQINLTLSCEQIPVGSTSDAISEPHLSEILIYPVKSCGYFKVRWIESFIESLSL